MIMETKDFNLKKKTQKNIIYKLKNNKGITSTNRIMIKSSTRKSLRKMMFYKTKSLKLHRIKDKKISNRFHNNKNTKIYNIRKISRKKIRLKKKFPQIVPNSNKFCFKNKLQNYSSRRKNQEINLELQKANLQNNPK